MRDEAGQMRQEPVGDGAVKPLDLPAALRHAGEGMDEADVGVKADPFKMGAGEIGAMIAVGEIGQTHHGPGRMLLALHGLVKSKGGLERGRRTGEDGVAGAKARFPDATFRVASFADLGIHDGQIGGILAWYSLIHIRSRDLQSTLGEFGRCIAPGGTLLVGFFDGTDGEAFPHAVTTAYSWSTDGMAARIVRAGFEVLEVQTRTDPGRRPHASMIARRSTPKSAAKITHAAMGY
ncbi:UNVERIFIED_ORG: hypothetical protein ABIB52_004045 [Arthrobacter sp. UYCu721]